MMIASCYVEISYLLTALFVLRLIIPRAIHKLSTSENLATWLGLKLFMQCFVGFWGSFLLTPQIHFFIPALLLCGSGICAYRKRNDGQSFNELFPLPTHKSEKLILALMTTAISAMIFASLRLVDETDSHHHMNYVVDWLHGNASAAPFIYTNSSPTEWIRSYVFFWESGNIPLLAVSPDDRLMWVNEVEGLLLFAFLFATIVYECGIKGWLRLAATMHALLIYSFWSSSTGGIATIKNDIPMHCGILLLILGLLIRSRSEARTSGIFYLVAGAAFITSKFSGPIIMIALTATSLLFLPRRAFKQGFLRNPLFLMAIGFLSTTFICFFRNLYVDGNPLYPVKITLFGHALPGVFNLAHSSIASHWQELDAWRFLLGINHNWPAGVLCWIMVIATVPALLRLLSKRKIISILSGTYAASAEAQTNYIAALCFVLFILFVSSYWSAGMPGSDLTYIETQNTYRYAMSWFALSTLFFALLCQNSNRLRAITFCGAVLAIDGFLRLRGIFYFEWFRHTGPSEAVALASRLAVWLTALSGTLYITHKSRAPAIVTAFAAVPLALILGGAQANMSRDNYMIWYPGLSSLFAEMPSKHIASLTSIDGILSDRLNQRDYPIVGKYFQHHIAPISLPDLKIQLTDEDKAPDFVTFMSTHHSPFENDEVAAVTSSLPSYALIQPYGHDLVWAHLSQGAVAKPPVQLGTEGSVAHIFASDCATTNQMKPTAYYINEHFLSADCGHLFVMNAPHSLRLPLENSSGDIFPDSFFTYDNGRAAIKIPHRFISATTFYPQAMGDRGKGWSHWQDGIDLQSAKAGDNFLLYTTTKKGSILSLNFEPMGNDNLQTSQTLSLVLRIASQGCTPELHFISKEALSRQMSKIRYIGDWRVPHENTPITYVVSDTFPTKHPLNNIGVEILTRDAGCHVSITAQILPGIALPNMSQIDIESDPL